MATNQWRFVYANKDFIPQGELFNASDRSLSLALSKLDTAAFSVRTDHPFADSLITLEGFLKIYRNNALIFYGPLIEAEENVGSNGVGTGRISISAASPAWHLQHRWVSFVQGPLGVVSLSRGFIAAAGIQQLNQQYYVGAEWPTGIYNTDINTPDKYRQTGHTLINSSSSTYPYTGGGTLSANWQVPAYKPSMDILQEISQGVDGFDWRFMPIENFVSGAWNGSPGIADPYFASPIGTSAPEAIFEFGAGKLNIKSYTRAMSRGQQANSVRHLLNVAQELTPPLAYNNPSKAKWGVIEDLAQADLTDLTLRQKLVDEHVLVRKEPRHTIVFEPTSDYGDGRLPRYGIDYNIGDTVTARAISLGKQRFNAQFRVWGVEFALDDLGVETPRLTLSGT